MRALLIAVLLLTAVTAADYDMDECQPPDVYADWSSPSECVDYYQDLEEEDEHGEEFTDDNNRL